MPMHVGPNLNYMDDLICALDMMETPPPPDSNFVDPSSWEERRHTARMKHLVKLKDWGSYVAESAEGKVPLSVRWVDLDGFVEANNRLATRGYEQTDEPDDASFYSATPFPAELKLFLTLAAIFDWIVEIGDAESAFS